jgi:pantothenate kinase-related protein Tda10
VQSNVVPCVNTPRVRQSWLLHTPSNMCQLSQAEAVAPGLGAVNAALRAYEAAWDRQVDSWLVVRIDDPSWVYAWRLQAEERMRASGKPGMTDAQIADFVERFQPAYRAYLPGLYAKVPFAMCLCGSRLECLPARHIMHAPLWHSC